MKHVLVAALVAASILHSTAATARQVKIPAGTIVVVQTLRSISSETAKGDEIVELQGGHLHLPAVGER